MDLFSNHLNRVPHSSLDDILRDRILEVVFYKSPSWPYLGLVGGCDKHLPQNETGPRHLIFSWYTTLNPSKREKSWPTVF